jgi:hypothetical protein
MRTTIALALFGLAAALVCQPAATEELRLRKVHDHRLVIEGPFGGTRGYVRATPSGRLVIENSWGRRVGTVRPLPGGERAILECGQRRGCLELPD